MKYIRAAVLALAVACSAFTSTDTRTAAPLQKSGVFPSPDSQGGWRSVREPEDVRRVAAMALDEAFEFIEGSSKHGGGPCACSRAHGACCTCSKRFGVLLRCTASDQRRRTTDVRTRPSLLCGEASHTTARERPPPPTARATMARL